MPATFPRCNHPRIPGDSVRQSECLRRIRPRCFLGSSFHSELKIVRFFTGERAHEHVAERRTVAFRT